MKWQTKLALVFGGIFLVVGGFIVYDIVTSPDIVDEVRLPGTFKEQQAWSFDIAQPGEGYRLMICPWMESGWGEPTMHIVFKLIDPQGKVLIDDKEGFGGEIKNVNTSVTVYNTGPREKAFPFAVASTGTYQVVLAVLTEHVKDVHISVGRKQ